MTVDVGALSSLSEVMGKAQTEAEWPADIVEFAEREYYVPADNKDGKELIRLEPHQKAILRLAFKMDETGRFALSLLIWSCIKKSGKTEMAALITLWACMTWEPGNYEMFACANDFDSARGRVFSAVGRAIEDNPRLKAVCRITQKMISFPNGTTLTALANDYAGAAGAQRLALSSFDELWAYISEGARRLWDEMTPIPTLKNSVRFVSTYAGFEGESELLHEFYKRIVCNGGSMPCDDNKVGPEELEGLDLPVYRVGRTILYWDAYDTAGEACRRMPWQQGPLGEAYYAEQVESLRPNAFKRLHWNLWTTSEDNLFPPEMWDKCVDEDRRPLLRDKRIVLDLGIDVGIKHDQASVVGVTYDADGRQVILGQHRTFQPSPEEPIDLEDTVEAFIRALGQAFTLRACYYDPYQFHRSATTLTKDGFPMVEYPQTGNRLTDMGQNLFELVKYGNLRVYPDEDMRKAALQVVAKETPRGWRIGKEMQSHKIDVIVSLALACLGNIITQSDRQVEQHPHFDRAKHIHKVKRDAIVLKDAPSREQMGMWIQQIRGGEQVEIGEGPYVAIVRQVLVLAMKEEAKRRPEIARSFFDEILRLDKLHKQEAMPL